MKKESGEVDVIVLGVGTSGEDISLQLLDAGLDVVGIEPSLVGGECPYWACLPSKMMIRAANSLKEARQVNSFAGEAKITSNWNVVAKRVGDLTANWNDSGAIKRYEEHGGRVIRGFGKLDGPNTVIADGQTFTAKKAIVIATGSRPLMPPVPGLADTEFWTTHSIMQMKELPDSMIIMGGGASGCELGQVLARFGVDITIIEMRDRLLPDEEPEASEVLENALIDEGIKVHSGTEVQKADFMNGSFSVKLAGGQELNADRLLVTTGRRVELEGLGLESIDIDETSDFLPVDENMQVKGNIYAIGDVTGKGFYSHVGLYQSSIAAAHILGKVHHSASYHAVPCATFTDPEVGRVGLTEAEAIDAGIPVAVIVKQLPLTFRGMVHGVESGMVKLIADRKKDIILGATVAGPYGVEIMGMLNLAIHAQIPISELRSIMYAFPSFYSTIGEAVGAYGRGVTTALDPSYEGIRILDALVHTVGQPGK